MHQTASFDFNKLHEAESLEDNGRSASQEVHRLLMALDR
jgi:hypothetical protein